METNRYIPLIMEKSQYIVPVHKKNKRQVMKNHRPISLLPICGKIFEKLSLTKFTNI